MPSPTPRSDEKAAALSEAVPAPGASPRFPGGGTGEVVPAPTAPQPAPPAPLPSSLPLFNSAPADAATALLLHCCNSTSWAARIAAFRPYPDAESLLAALDEASYDMTAEDVAEALSAESPLLPDPWGEGSGPGAYGDETPGSPHGAHGRGVPARDVPHSETPGHRPAGDEAPARGADRDRRGVLAAHTALRAAHAAYEHRFGHPFLVCLDEWAEGERLGQALAEVRARLGNDPEEERPIVAEELRRLARGRLLRALR